MNTRTILIATLLASAFAPALAEDYTIDQGSDGERRIVIRQGTVTLPPGQQAAQRAGDSASLAASMLRISGAGIVKNAPYSAEAVSESMQRLADGNQIVNTSRSMQYRDGAGRTRTEVHGDDGEVRTITISDPVEGARWILNPQRKSATRLDMTSELARAEADAARAPRRKARAPSPTSSGARPTRRASASTSCAGKASCRRARTSSSRTSSAARSRPRCACVSPSPCPRRGRCRPRSRR